ncbi:MAG: dihydroneopterin aldolase [Actinomycetales bacterium]|nr:dihydroneopterin aldolase [Actinomycetales bacterium]
MSDRIEIRGLRCAVIVGVLAEERERQQPVEIDIDFDRPIEEAAMSDDLAETTNYAEVISLAQRVATEGRFLLLETLVYRVAREVLDYDEAIEAVTVAARKLRPPVPEDVATVGVRTTIRR